MTDKEFKKQLKELVVALPYHRRAFEMVVEAACLEVIEMSKQISPTIGEISTDEAYEAIVNEFKRRLFS